MITIARGASSWVLAFSVFSAATYGAGCGGNDGATGGGGGGGGPEGGGNDATIGDGGIIGTGGGEDSGGGPGPGADGSAGGSNPCVPPTQLVIAPASETVSVSVGTPFTQTLTATATYPGGSTADVTAQTFFASANPNVGTVSGATFTWGGVNGGAATISGKTCGVTSNTILTLQLTASFGSGPDDGGASFDAGGEPGAFADAGTTSNPSCNPTLVYPPDGVLLPPNTNVIEIQFYPGSASGDAGGAPNTQFEISFQNAATDVKIFTACTPLNGGCVFDLSQTEWDYIAQTNAGGAPVTVKVSGLGCDASNAGASNTRNISFGQEPLAGALYYWASINAINSQATFSGGVFRYDFGVRGQTADPVLTPTYGGNGLCIGCHDISRDGRLMLFDYDDNDADDEYTDVNTDIFDVAARTFATGTLSKGQAFEPGFHTWNRLHSEFLLSDGAHITQTNGQNPVAPNGAFTVRSSDAGLVGLTPPPPVAIRGTTPDMAPDDSKVVFVAAPNDAGSFLPDGGTVPGYMPLQGTSDPEQDEWFAGASLYVAPWSDSTSQLGAEAMLIPSNGTNNFYYPSFSPEGSLIAFNYAPSGPNFHNPLARVKLVPSGAASPTPDDLPNLNNDPTNGGEVTNSWARWAPFVQSYKGGQILWLTMSSTRDYGLRIRNDGDENCYPTEGPQVGGGGPPPPPGQPGPLYARTITTNNISPPCTRAQLWMAAIKLDPSGVAAGQDVSFPPFWLPFQDLTTNNHLGQWAQQAYSGTCNVAAADAGAAPDAGGCAPGLCCFNGGCAACLPTPPPTPPTPPSANACSVNANCATGTCCIAGSCGACAGTGVGTDGGGSEDSGSGGPTCNTCLDCNGQACNGGQCGSCTSSAQCCAPLECNGVGQCATVAK